MYNRLIKTRTAIIVCLFMLFCLVMPVSAQTYHVFDNANLLTDEEVEKIESVIDNFISKTNMDFVVLTNSEPHNSSAQVISDDFYDYNGFGIGDSSNGMLYFIDMYERTHYISTTGEMISILTDQRIDNLIEKAGSYLTDKNYAEGIIYMINNVEAYVNSGGKMLSSGEITMCFLIAIVVLLVFVFGVKKNYNLKGKTYSYAYQNQTDIDITSRLDQYTHTTVSRVRKQEPKSDGGGSSTHTSSSGETHGGGGGSF